MIFNSQNYPTIKSACQCRSEVEFIAEKSDTVFADSAAPEQWRPYPPAMLPPEGYADVFLHSGTDARGALMRLELLVHLDGGRILYKENGNSQVRLKIMWPENS